MTLINVFRSDPKNVGDWYCAPHRYFLELGSEVLDISGTDLPPKDSLLIVGGGGLISPSGSFTRLKTLTQEFPSIGWGLGENWRIHKEIGYMSPVDNPQTFPSWLSNFKALGLRDLNSPFQHVPCASCLHEAFDNPSAPKRKIGFYAHKRIPLASGKHPIITNDGSDMESKIEFLAHCEVIVTNSYHGAYWGMLLNRRVICVPFGTKFFALHPSLTFSAAVGYPSERNRKDSRH